eukprot:TRINITY_DN6191_c0_g1_i1.p1 TRINITY_DN6191_c0_g1~~TRINITY_DN6191_c0_g1_i1.p1  ORF type:complete len:329 (+),score=64.77 TRINITY_DN6191_c0_g1_i1:51-989(+)
MPLYWMGLTKGLVIECQDEEPRSVHSWDDGKERRVKCLYKNCNQTFRTMRFLKLHIGQHRQNNDKPPADGEEYRYLGKPKATTSTLPKPTSEQRCATAILSSAWDLHSFTRQPFCYICGLSVRGFYDDHVFQCKASMVMSLKRSFLPPNKYLPRPPSVSMDEDLTAYNLAALAASKAAYVTCRKCNKRFTARIKDGCTHSEFHVHELTCSSKVLFEEELRLAKERLKLRSDQVRRDNAGCSATESRRSKSCPKTDLPETSTHATKEEITKTYSEDGSPLSTEQEDECDNDLHLEEISEEEYEEEETSYNEIF